MKKKNLKSLKFTKKTVANLSQNKAMGGTSLPPIISALFCPRTGTLQSVQCSANLACDPNEDFKTDGSMCCIA